MSGTTSDALLRAESTEKEKQPSETHNGLLGSGVFTDSSWIRMYCTRDQRGSAKIRSESERMSAALRATRIETAIVQTIRDASDMLLARKCW